MGMLGSYDLNRRTLLRAAGLLAAPALTQLAPAASAAAAPATASPAPATGYDPELGDGVELLIDDHRIESAENVARVIHPGTKVVHPDTGSRMLMRYGEKPWEPTRVQLYGSVIYDSDERIFKMWYRTLLPSGGPRLCYATSEDGLRWEKPVLGLYEFEGSRENNISTHIDMAAVLKDDRDPDPSRRYKLFGCPRMWEGYWVYFSADGLRWSGGRQVLPNGDTCSAAYDPRTGRFLATTKQAPYSERRAYLSTSTDFEEWSAPQLILEGDERGDHLAKASPLVTDIDRANEQIYACPVIPYEGAYLGLPWSFEYTGGNGPGGNDDGHVRPQLAFSRDLTTWVRPGRTHLIDSGPAGSFDAGIIQGTTNDIVVTDDEIRLYYGGFNTSHGGPLDRKRVGIGLVTWRLDGFASMTNGGDEPGVLTTRPVLVGGDHLHVNADLTSQPARPAQLRVELLDEGGTPLPGFTADDAVPIRGDRVDVVAQWHGGAGPRELRGRAVRLRFHLSGGDLYSYHFSDTRGPRR